MSVQLKKKLNLLKVLKKAKPVDRKSILESADNETIVCICECIDNLLHGNVKISHIQKKQLAKYARLLRTIADRKTPVKKKRQLLVQKGGFLPALLAPVLGVASGLIGELVGNLVRR